MRFHFKLFDCKRNSKKTSKNSSVKENEDSMIIPLSASDDLADNSMYTVYRNYIIDTFKESRIRNIAVTGNFGVGKSSILRTFSKKENKKFLYISLAEFIKSDHTDKTCRRRHSRKRTQEKFEVQAFEAAILRQLISVCHCSDIPQVGFQTVKEKWTLFYKAIQAIFIGMYTAMLYTLIFPSQISEFIHKFLPNASLHCWHITLYILVGIFTSVIIGYFVYKLLRHTKIKEISASVPHIQASVCAEFDFNESILTKYNNELVYILEALLHKKYSAIVFEDMDRIDYKISVEILTKLRELNYSVNERSKERVLRFFYVMNDELVEKFNSTKFFDYILPIFPTLGHENAAQKMDDILNNIGIDDIHRDVFCNLARKITSLSDYRTLNDIQNEYRVLESSELYKKSEYHPQELSSTEKAHIMAFIVYKVLLPEDYYKIRECKSVIFHSFTKPDSDADISKDQLYETITELQNTGYLQPECLRYLGYTESEMITFCRNTLSSGDITRKRNAIMNAVEPFYFMVYEKDTDERKNYVKGIEDVFMKYHLSLPECTSEILEEFIGIIKEKGEGASYTDSENEMCANFLEYSDERQLFILRYFIKRKHTDFKWLENLIDDAKTGDQCCKILNQLGDTDMEYIVSYILVTLNKNNKTVRKYSKLLEIVRKLNL